ncbi:MAG: glycoside hydrolase family 2 TIM barrel-domain containing protein [Eubacteriales bacterium]|nr:glycoside hydrolase family 2 TIM barrel-domain containing protein [Eubacteriales bacterium]
MCKNRYNLSQCAWRVKGTAPYVPLRENSMETGKPLEGITGWISADVPGGVALALYRAGYIPHPYVGMNSLQCEWIENKWWVYETKLTLPPQTGKRVRVDLEGVDYECLVYWNGFLLGSHTGMFEAFSFDVTELYEEGAEAVLRVLICHAPDEMGQIGRTSETFTQKSRFNYKWDFSTRLVNLGIWQDVFLTFWDDVEFTDVFVHGERISGTFGNISASAVIDGQQKNQRLTCCMECMLHGEKVGNAEIKVMPGERFSLSVPIERPDLWYPNGLGMQPLYDVTLKLLEDDKLLETCYKRIGIRSIECVQNDSASNDARPYLFVVNGKRIYIKGVNVTPLDHIYGDVPYEQIYETLRRAKEMNCNMVRVWGGGLIETEDFYDCCDTLGLMVWQEFIQSSSGIDNIPSERPGFLELLKRSAEAAVRQKRNHTSLVVWSGGNELMEVDRTPCTEQNRNIAMLEGIVHRLDPNRVFLPTSASGPSEFISKIPDQSHDVHGWWQYQGNPEQYTFFGNSDSLFHSEFGCDGMSSLASLRRILSPEMLHPVPMCENDIWRFHGDWWCTYRREQDMFGSWNGLEQYIACSQWMQAEGLRYILEANRRRCFRNSGSIIWQLNEPWPNVSCTNLIEYHGTPKMAYFWAKMAFQSVHPVFNYRKLDYAPGELLSGDLIVLREDAAIERSALTTEIFDMQGILLYKMDWECTHVREGAEEFGTLCWRIPERLHGLFLLRLTAHTDGDYTNIYYFSTEKVHPYGLALSAEPVLDGEAVLDERGAKVELCNTGRSVALHVCLSDQIDEFLLDVEDNFFTLLPGEIKRLRVGFRHKFRFGFDENIGLSAKAPKLQATCLSGETIILNK